VFSLFSDLRRSTEYLLEFNRQFMFNEIEGAEDDVEGDAADAAAGAGAGVDAGPYGDGAASAGAGAGAGAGMAVDR
jgi:hypothetical protein